jgi:hypothetical protein
MLPGLAARGRYHGDARRPLNLRAADLNFVREWALVTGAEVRIPRRGHEGSLRAGPADRVLQMGSAVEALSKAACARVG